MKMLIIALSLIASSAMAQQDVYQKVMRARVGQLGKVLSDKSVQAQVIKDGYDLDSVRFIEADDGNTEPLYVIQTSKLVGDNWVQKCFTVMFDTDEPKVPAVVSESADACSY